MDTNVATLMTKQDDVETYTHLYKLVHGTTPNNVELHSWTTEELQAGIRVLKMMEVHYATA